MLQNPEEVNASEIEISELNRASNPFDENLVFFQEPDSIRKIGLKLKQKTQSEMQKRQSWYKDILNSMKSLGLLSTDIREGQDVVESVKKLENPVYCDNWQYLTAHFSSELFPVNAAVKAVVKNRMLLEYEEEKLKAQYDQQMQEQQQQIQNLPPEQQQQIQSQVPPFQPYMDSLDKLCEFAEWDINNKIFKEWQDFISEFENGISSAFLTGSALFTVNYDKKLNRPILDFITPENVLIDADAKSLDRADFIIIIEEKRYADLMHKINNGEYAEVILPTESTSVSETKGIKNYRDRLRGFNREQIETEKKDRLVQVGTAYITLSTDDIKDDWLTYQIDEAPYQIKFIIQTGYILEIKRGYHNHENNRNWLRKKLNLFLINYMKGFDLWGLGLGQLSQSLHGQSSTMLREFLTSMLYSNAPVLIAPDEVQSKVMKIDLKPGTVQVLSTPDGKLNLFPVPFKDANPLMFEMLRDIETKEKNISGISTLSVENLPANIKASVLLAILDKDTKPMSGVLKRMIFGINQMLRIVKEILFNEMGEQYFGDVQESSFINAHVYNENIELESAADPTISSGSAQLVRMQTMLETALSAPEYHNMHEVLNKFYNAMRLEDLDKILLSPEELQQAQQAQAEQAQQAAAQQQAQVDAQNQLLMADIENKEKDSQRKAAIAQEKLNQEQMKSQNELQISMIREQGEVKKQEEINQREIFKTMINYIIEQAKLKGDYGILLPSLMPPELKEYMMREMPNEYEQINQINSMR